jgi:O-antigen/teichoic acid export membrane protein
MDLTHSLGVASLLITVAATVVAVESGLGLQGVALAQLLGVTLFYAAVLGVSRRIEPGWRLELRAFDASWLRRLVHFGGILHISTICGTVNRQLDKVLLTNWVGLPAVTSYEIAARLVANTGSFQPYLAAALLPAASHLESVGRRRELVELYRRGSRYLFLLGVPPFIFLAANARTVMIAWLGRPEPLAAAVLLVLAGGYLVNSASNGMAFVCQGIGRPGLQARQSAIQLVANVVGSVVLLEIVGPLGAPLGTSLALILGAAVFARSVHRVLDLSTMALLREAALVPLIASLSAAAAGSLAASWIETGTRTGALLALAVHGLVFTLVYLAVCRATGFLRMGEVGKLLRTLRSSGTPR